MNLRIPEINVKDFHWSVRDLRHKRPPDGPLAITKRGNPFEDIGLAVWTHGRAAAARVDRG